MLTLMYVFLNNYFFNRVLNVVISDALAKRYRSYKSSFAVCFENLSKFQFTL